MTHTYFQLFYHLVWSTKNREMSIPSAFEKRLHDFIRGTFKTKAVEIEKRRPRYFYRGLQNQVVRVRLSS